ncbi:Transcriptional regulator, contains HTH domain [Halorhabdus sp. BNX81]|nr:Transcriptional regulator, contains HTH domain [Halorhabdus sp. BNX81]
MSVMAQTFQEIVVTEATADRALERIFGLNTSEQAVYRALLAAAEPLSAEALAAELDCALATAYRYLETLEEHKLITEVTTWAGTQQPAVYEAVGPDRVAERMEDCLERAYQRFSAEIDSVVLDAEDCPPLDFPTV